jgi:hypothetical protein
VFYTGRPFQPTVMFVSKATVYPREATFLFLLCPTSKTLDSAGKACQTQITLAYWVHSTLSITITSVVLLSFIMQSVAVFYCYSEDSYAECHYADVVMLSVVMLSVVAHSVSGNMNIICLPENGIKQGVNLIYY